MTEKDVKKMVAVCKKHSIRLIPQVNLLGHQSWHSKATKLLEVYPQFDENPEVKLPEEYKWPNAEIRPVLQKLLSASPRSTWGRV
ncbi:MAG: hypothetical protein R3C61_06655 [Bacteroidia bacterium]